MSTRAYTNTPARLLAAARREGRRKGEACADFQYLPGGGRDTARDAAGRARALLKAYDDGDPAVTVFDPPAWLSGEWADEPVTRDVFELCGGDPDRDPEGETAQDVADAYCAAADEAYTSAICRFLRDVAKGDA